MKVLIVDDHGLFRQGLSMLLSEQAGFSTVLQAANAQEALAIQNEHPDLDLVLLDYNLGTDLGLDVLEQLKLRDPALPVTVVSGREDPQAVLSALGGGASGFIPKSLNTDLMIEAIQSVLNGGIYVPPDFLTHQNTTLNQPNSNPFQNQQKQLQHLTSVARRVIKEKNLNLRHQATVESEMTYALNRLVSELQNDRLRLEALAFQDDLTGLANRRLFLERLEQALRNSRRSRTLMALVYLDLDHFKQINDTLGHQNGDILLKEIGHRLAASVREVDTASRLGGDEFTLVLVDIQSEEALQQQLARVQTALTKPVTLENGQCCAPSTSIGAAISDGNESSEDLIKRADDTLYAVKGAGRGHFIIAPGLTAFRLTET